MPLTKAQLAEIKGMIEQAEVSLKDAMSDIAQAKRAGIDVTDPDTQVRTLREQIRKLKVVYV